MDSGSAGKKQTKKNCCSHGVSCVVSAVSMTIILSLINRAGR